MSSVPLDPRGPARSSRPPAARHQLSHALGETTQRRARPQRQTRHGASSQLQRDWRPERGCPQASPQASATADSPIIGLKLFRAACAARQVCGRSRHRQPAVPVRRQRFGNEEGKAASVRPARLGHTDDHKQQRSRGAHHRAHTGGERRKTERPLPPFLVLNHTGFPSAFTVLKCTVHRNTRKLKYM